MFRAFLPSGSVWVRFLLFLRVSGPSVSVWVCFLLCVRVIGPTGARLGLVVLVVSCHWALGVRLGLFLPVFACLWALGVRLGLFPPVFFESLGPRGSFGLVSFWFYMFLLAFGVRFIYTHTNYIQNAFLNSRAKPI